MRYNKNYYYLFLIFSFAFSLRLFSGIYLNMTNEVDFPDTYSYYNLGKSLTHGEISQNHHYLPLYSLLVFFFKMGDGLVVFDCLVSSFTCVSIYFLTKNIFKSESASYLASLIFLVYPASIFLSSSKLSENLFIFLLITGFTLFFRRHFFLAFILFVLSNLTRGILDFFYPFFIVFYLFFIFKFNLRKTFKYFFLYVFLYSLFFSGWWFYQYKRYGEFIRTTFSASYVFYIGNNEHSSSGGVANEQGKQEQDMSKFNLDHNNIKSSAAEMKKIAFQFITNKPKEYLQLLFKKTIRFWQPVPFNIAFDKWLYKLLMLLSYGSVIFLSIFYIFFNFSKLKVQSYSLLVLVLYIFVIHLLTIVSIRYRYPIEIILIIFASKSLVDFFNAWKHKNEKY